MKEKIIEAAGKTWRALGEQGETDAGNLARIINEKEDVVNQAIGWLAREDKIAYSQKRNKLFFSLVASELQAFNNLRQGRSASSAQSQSPRKKSRLKFF